MNKLIIALVFLLLTPQIAASQTKLILKGLDDAAPLALTAAATESRLLIDVVMKPEWHLYAKDIGGGQPVAVIMAKDSGFVSAGELVIPKTGNGQLIKTFCLELPIRRKATGGQLKANFNFMACDPLMCMPPMSVEITGTVVGKASIKVLLAVDVEDERSKRIKNFLGENGLVATVRTYGAATQAECDAHDVVLFDSKRFRKTARGARQAAIDFPKTKTPMVAVGFLGTELIEAHGLAMTSGYI
ncbi:MAG: hypothetical protein ACI97A_003658 [Planctomycetota bacterium]|jgi:hypothetical protein